MTQLDPVGLHDEWGWGFGKSWTEAVYWPPPIVFTGAPPTCSFKCGQPEPQLTWNVSDDVPEPTGSVNRWLSVIR